MQTRVGRIYRLWIDITILTNSCTRRQYQRPSYRLEKHPRPRTSHNHIISQYLGCAIISTLPLLCQTANNAPHLPQLCLTSLNHVAKYGMQQRQVVKHSKSAIVLRSISNHLHPRHQPATYCAVPPGLYSVRVSSFAPHIGQSTTPGPSFNAVNGVVAP